MKSNLELIEEVLTELNNLIAILKSPYDVYGENYYNLSGQKNRAQESYYKLWENKIIPWIYEEIPILKTEKNLQQLEERTFILDSLSQFNLIICSLSEIAEKFVDQTYKDDQDYAINSELIKKFNEFLNFEYSKYQTVLVDIPLYVGMQNKYAQTFKSGIDKFEIVKALNNLLDESSPLLRPAICFYKIAGLIESNLLNEEFDRKKSVVAVVTSCMKQDQLPQFKTQIKLEDCITHTTTSRKKQKFDFSEKTK